MLKPNTACTLRSLYVLVVLVASHHHSRRCRLHRRRHCEDGIDEKGVDKVYTKHFLPTPGHTPSSSKLLKVAQTNPSRRYKRLLRNLLGAVRAALGTSLARGRLEREEATRRRPRPARFRLWGLKTRL